MNPIVNEPYFFTDLDNGNVLYTITFPDPNTCPPNPIADRLAPFVFAGDIASGQSVLSVAVFSQNKLDTNPAPPVRDDSGTLNFNVNLSQEQNPAGFDVAQFDISGMSQPDVISANVTVNSNGKIKTKPHVYMIQMGEGLSKIMIKRFSIAVQDFQHKFEKEIKLLVK